MYLLYVDASGDPGWPLPEGKSKTKWYVLAGLCLDESRWKSAHQVSRRLISKYFSFPYPKPRELRYSSLRAGHGPYEHLTPERRAQLTDEVFATLGGLDPTLFAVAVNKERHRAKYKERAYPPDSWAMRLLLPRFHKFLDRKDAFGAVMMDAEERRKEGRLWRTVEIGRENGIVIPTGPSSGYQRTNTKLERVVENVMFLKSDTSDLIQLADFCCGAVWAHFEKGDASRFKQIYPMMDRVDEIVYGFKVWPVPVKGDPTTGDFDYSDWLK